MDIIWVPEPCSGNSGSDNGSPLSNEFSLFLIGFVILAGCAAAGSLLADGEVAKVATKFGMDWVINLVAFFPWLGYLFATTGALVGVLKSSATMKRRLFWFAATQAVATFLWFASTLH